MTQHKANSIWEFLVGFMSSHLPRVREADQIYQYFSSSKIQAQPIPLNITLFH